MGYILKDYYEGQGTYSGQAYKLCFLEIISYTSHNGLNSAMEKADSNELILFGNLDAEI